MGPWTPVLPTKPVMIRAGLRMNLGWSQKYREWALWTGLMTLAFALSKVAAIGGTKLHIGALIVTLKLEQGHGGYVLRGSAHLNICGGSTRQRKPESRLSLSLSPSSTLRGR